MNSKIFASKSGGQFGTESHGQFNRNLQICIEKQVPMSKKKKVEVTSQTAALQKVLQEAELKIKALNTLIDVAEEQLKIDIRKKSGARQS